MDASPPLESRLSAGLLALATAPAVALAAIQIAWCWPFFSDDAFISLRFSARLLSGDGLTWSPGAAVEGYSNLLWVLLCAGLGAIGLDLVAAARLLGFVATGATFVLLAAAARPRTPTGALLAALPPLLVASSPQVMSWTASGLEGPLVMLLLAWGLRGLLHLLERSNPIDSPPPATGRLLACGVPFALLVWTRPDGPLWALTAGAALAPALWRHGAGATASRILAFGALPALALALQVAFRLVYYGDWLPNTAHVKVDLDGTAWGAGWIYIKDGLWTVQGLGWLALAAAVGLLCRRSTRAAVPVLVLPLLAWLLYLASVGGDHFAGYRLMQPALAPLGLLIAWAARRLPAHRMLAGGLVLLAAAGTAGNVAITRREPLCVFNRSETWEWQGKVIGEVLGQAFDAEQPTIAVDAAGAVPFYSRLPALDMLGLCDRTIATTATPDWAAAAAQRGGLVRTQGHMRGNGRYVLDRAPDLIQFAKPPGMPLPVFLSGLELETDPRFLADYRLMVLDLDKRPWAHGLMGPITSYVWVRVQGRAGIAVTENRIEVPGHLLGALRPSRAIMVRNEPMTTERLLATKEFADALLENRRHGVIALPSGELALQVRAQQEVTLDLGPDLLGDVEAAASTWHVEITPATAGVTGTIEAGRIVVRAGPAVKLPWTVRQVTLTQN
ncbi:MAG: hypothetical protein NXI31_02135 [bacterium]|nr:hypothetical protein [bacterium]